jgi:hypothetical protein
MRLRVLILCVCLAGSAVAARAADDDASASLSGHVVRDPDGAPIKKALVELIEEDSFQPHTYSATTDTDGAFDISGMHPGMYAVLVERTGYILVNAKHHKQAASIISLAKNQAITGQTFHMLPCAVVMGRVFDEDGDPMPEAYVELQRWMSASKTTPIGSERTNDLGEYRISGLAPGRYLVSVTPALDVAGMLNHDRQKSKADSPAPTSPSYVPMFYPNTTDRAQSSPLELRAGDELSINFSLLRLPTVHLRGTVVASHPSQAEVILHPTGYGGRYDQVDVNRDGSFEVRQVPPGLYDLLAVESTGDKVRVALEHEVVSTTDIEGIHLTPQAGATVRGHLRAPDTLKLSHVSLSLTATSEHQWEDSIALLKTVHPASDGSFVWNDVPPGDYYIEARVDATTSNYVVDSVVLAGREFRDTVFPVNGGTLLFAVSLSATGCTIEGDAVDDKGLPVSSAVILASPDGVSATREDRFAMVTSDQRGHFVVKGLLPGSYSALAFEALEENIYLDPAFRRTYLDQATKVTLDPASTKHIELKALPAPDDAPAE